LKHLKTQNTSNLFFLFFSEERAKKARDDPEIKIILSDPTIQKVLEAARSDPQAINRAMKDESLRIKLEKLIASGIFNQKESSE
jgi:hypothetical protein